MYPQRVGRQKHLLNIEFNFNDRRRGGNDGPRKNGPPGAGGDRRGPRDGPRDGPRRDGPLTGGQRPPRRDVQPRHAAAVDGAVSSSSSSPTEAVAAVAAAGSIAAVSPVAAAAAAAAEPAAAAATTTTAAAAAQSFGGAAEEQRQQEQRKPRVPRHVEEPQRRRPGYVSVHVHCDDGCPSLLDYSVSLSFELSRWLYLCCSQRNAFNERNKTEIDQRSFHVLFVSERFETGIISILHYFQL